jgi:hypothetical protein
MVISQACCTLGAAVVGLASSMAEAGTPWTVDELTRWLMREETVMRGLLLDSTIEVLVSAPRVTASRYEDPDDHDDLDWINRLEYRWRSYGPRLRLDVTREGPDGLFGRHGLPAAESRIWDGHKLVSFRYDRSEWTITSGLRVDDQIDALTVFNNGLGPTFANSRLPLSRRIADAELVQIDSSGSEWLYEFSPADGRRLMLVIETDPTPRIRELSYKVLDDEVDGVMNFGWTLRCRALEWSEFNGRLLPVLAVRQAFVYDHVNGQAQHLVARTVLRRKDASVTQGPLDRDMLGEIFHWSPNEGETISDFRIPARYRVGDKKVVIDGRTFLQDSAAGPDLLPLLDSMDLTPVPEP